MPHIDCYDHSHVGSICGIALYHPLVNIPVEGTYNWVATPENFLLGGGSGEHSSMIIRNLAFCVYLYLEHIGELQDKELLELCVNYEQRMQEPEYQDLTLWNNLQYEWDMNSIVRFALTVKNDFETVETAYKQPSNYPEKDFQILLGQVIHENAMHLLSIKDVDIISEIEHILDMTKIPRWNSFMAAMPGKSYGRYFRRDENGNVGGMQSLCFEQEYIAHPHLNSIYTQGKILKK